MKPMDCEFESEALAAVIEARWPEQASAALREHVSACAICSDIVTVAGAIDSEREELRAHVIVPDSGRVWWLAQIRARREAAQAAARPITIAQVLAFACAVGVLGACFDVRAVLASHTVLVLGTAAVLLLVPAAVYLAIRD